MQKISKFDYNVRTVLIAHNILIRYSYVDQVLDLNSPDQCFLNHQKNNSTLEI